MRTKILLLVGMLFAGTIAASHAGGAAGVRWGGGAAGVRWGGGGCGAAGVRWGGGGRYWGGGRAYCAPRYYAPRAYGWGWGWGWGWRRPVVGVRIVAPAPVFVAGGPVGAPISSGSVVAAAQEQLAGLGYYNGGIDGAFGPMTSAAVQRFQSDNGLAVTGRLDRSTRTSLGI